MAPAFHDHDPSGQRIAAEPTLATRLIGLHRRGGGANSSRFACAARPRIRPPARQTVHLPVCTIHRMFVHTRSYDTICTITPFDRRIGNRTVAGWLARTIAAWLNTQGISSQRIRAWMGGMNRTWETPSVSDGWTNGPLVLKAAKDLPWLRSPIIGRLPTLDAVVMTQDPGNAHRKRGAGGVVAWRRAQISRVRAPMPFVSPRFVSHT